MQGWIKLHRKLIDHWIWTDPIKLKWWLDLLFEVNHEAKKVVVGMDLIDCKRGQSVKSLKNWGDRWNVSKTTARSFLNLLQKDKMITIESLTKTTRITICNYGSYQTGVNDNKPQKNRRKTAEKPQTDTNNNEKELKNEENVNKIYSLYPSKCPIKNTPTNKSPKHKDKIKTLLKSIPVEDLELSITTYINQCTNDKVWIKNFNTFLNNIPECSESENKKDQLFTVQYSNFDSPHEHTQEQIDRYSKNNEIKWQRPCKN